MVEGPALASAAQRLARLLAERGLARGDRVLLAVGNGPRFAAALAAVVGAGGSPILLHAQTPLAELVRIDPKAIAGSAPAAAPSDISSKLPTDVSQLLKSGPGLPGLGGSRFPGLPGLGGFTPKKK